MKYEDRLSYGEIEALGVAGANKFLELVTGMIRRKEQQLDSYSVIRKRGQTLAHKVKVSIWQQRAKTELNVLCSQRNLIKFFLNI